MKCRTAVRKISAFLDGELSSEEEEALSKHFQSCESCRVEHREMSLVSESLDLVEDVAPPAFLALKVRQRIREGEKSSPFPASSFGRAWRARLVAAAVAVLSVSFLVGGGLGRGIYELRAERASREELEIADFLGVDSFGGASEGSLVSAYNDLLTTEGDQ